jgi:hypothetical protein
MDLNVGCAEDDVPSHREDLLGQRSISPEGATDGSLSRVRRLDVPGIIPKKNTVSAEKSRSQ